MNKTTAKGVLTDLLYAYAADEYGDYFYEHGDVVCEAVECIMREQPRWISVEERLPEDGVRVLTACDDGIVRLNISKGGFPSVINRQHRFSDVTHWMPLPSTEGLE